MVRLRRGKRRMVRLHLDGADESVEGILDGIVDGHYLLLAPRLLETADRSRELSGSVMVPMSRVLFLQVNP